MAMACSCVGTGIWEIVASMTCGREGSGMVPALWSKRLWEQVLALFGPVGQCASAHSVHLIGTLQGSMGPWRALLLPYQEGAGGGFK